MSWSLFISGSRVKIRTVEGTDFILLLSDDVTKIRILHPEAQLPVAVAVPGQLFGQQAEFQGGGKRLLVGECGMGQQELVGDVLAGGQARLQMKIVAF